MRIEFCLSTAVFSSAVGFFRVRAMELVSDLPEEKHVPSSRESGKCVASVSCL